MLHSVIKVLASFYLELTVITITLFLLFSDNGLGGHVHLQGFSVTQLLSGLSIFWHLKGVDTECVFTLKIFVPEVI